MSSKLHPSCSSPLATSTGSRVKRWGMLLLKTLLVVALLLFGLSSQVFIDMAEGLTPALAVAAAAIQPIIVLGLFVHAYRHRMLIGTPVIRLLVAFQAMVLAQGLNVVLPARVSELIKATYLRDHASVPLGVGISAVVLERVVDTLIVGALGLLAAVQFFDRGSFFSIPLLGGMIGAGFWLVIKFPVPVLKVLRRIPSVRLADTLARAYTHLSETARTAAFMRAVLIGILVWGLSYLNIVVFLSLAGSIEVGLSGALLVFVMTTLGAAIPALPGGLGTYEAAAVIALRSLGYSFDEALVLALTMHAAQLMLPFGMAMVLMLQRRLGILSLISDIRGRTRD